MSGFNIKNIIYLLFIATIFYFIIGKIFKVIKFKKLNQFKKGLYFSIFILLFYFFYKVVPILLFGYNKITEGMSLFDQVSSSDNSGGGDGSIDYTKGWDTADNFRAQYCNKNPIYVEQTYFDSQDANTGNPNGGLIYGGRKEIYDTDSRNVKKDFTDALTNQIKKGNKVDTSSFTKDNGCSTNLKNDIGATGNMSQMCNPKCNFKFTGANSSSDNNDNNDNSNNN